MGGVERGLRGVLQKRVSIVKSEHFLTARKGFDGNILCVFDPKALLAYCIPLIAVLSNLSLASDLIEISPVTDQILMLHFDDGYVEHHGPGEDGNSDAVFKKAFSIRKGENHESYTITSPDDANYTDARHPERIGRKSKGEDFTINYARGKPYVMEHYIYLVLPFPMKESFSYNIQLDGLAQNGDDFTFRFNTSGVRSETIHVNQIGYAPQAPVKLAYLSHWAGDLGAIDLAGYQDRPFSLITAGGCEIKYSGNVALRKRLKNGGPDCGYPDHAPYGSYTGADVYVCDFSDFDETGEYLLHVETMGTSFPFRIHRDVFREAFYTTIRGLYHQRCGTALEEPYTHWTRGCCHHPAETDTVILSGWMYMDGSNAFSQLPQFATAEKRPYWGGWHDAGDWDRRHLHLDACQALMLVYELRPQNFSDDELDIPESGNGIPDILDEAKWTVDFFKRMQDRDGGVHGGLETIHHPQQGVGSVEDGDQWYAYAPDPVVTFHYAGSACQMGYCLELAGYPELKGEYIASARKAYNWAIANTRAQDIDTAELRDQRFFAAAWLYKTTGEPSYQEQFVEDNRIANENSALSEWQQREQEWGVWTFVTADRPDINMQLKERLEKAALNWAHSAHINSAKKRGYRFGSHWWTPVSWGQATIPRILSLAVAHRLTGDEIFLSYAYTTCDYVLGANPLNMVWVTGLGERSPKEVLHIDSWYYHREKGMAPGLVPFGPRQYTEGALDPWNYYWGMHTAYPDATEWPSHELWFENRYSPSTNELVVNNIGAAAAAYGYLCHAGGKYTKTEKTEQMTVANHQLFQNYPNPFNSYTIISFTLFEASEISINIYNVKGQRVARLFEGKKERGAHSVKWDAADFSSGIYFAKLTAGHNSKIVKCMAIK